ncbi:capping alpha-like subunit [Cystoisospora suis]|uniref:Capping alpha-like subunit n=1 Tax=Cystoisospora suis TaxID=483139 RepID=A0A2C6L048_9APIC|nr:capping alpha-like subunit [Cystoisospora suis]
MDGDPPAAADAVRPAGEGRGGQVYSGAEERERCIVHFFAKHSPPDQLKSVMEDCELLAEDKTLMNFGFIEDVCETAHDDALALFPFVLDGDSTVYVGIMCREGKLSKNTYLHPPLKLIVTVSHADCGVFWPPRPAPSSFFPEELEPYRRALEEAFSHYVSQRYANSAMGSLRSSVRARVATCVYSRIIPEGMAAGASSSAPETPSDLRGGSSTPVDGLKNSQEFTYEPSHSATAIDFIKEGGNGPIHKLTAIMSMRHCNAESCWAASWTAYWEIYFSHVNKRLAVEGEVRVRSHSCEDWNAQLDYRRVFRRLRAKGHPAPTSSKVASTGNSGSSDAAANSVSCAAPERAASNVEDSCKVDGSRRSRTALRSGLYLENCEDVEEPTGLSMRFMAFLRRTDEDVFNDERQFRHVYVPQTLRALRRVLPFTGRSFDWQQQTLQLQPNQQL